MYEWEKWSMPTQAERIAIVETKVTNIESKIDDLDTNVKEVDRKLDLNKTDLLGQLEKMYTASCEQHAQLAKKLDAVEHFNNKWSYLILGGFAVASFILAHWDRISKILN